MWQNRIWNLLKLLKSLKILKVVDGGWRVCWLEEDQGQLPTLRELQEGIRNRTGPGEPNRTDKLSKSPEPKRIEPNWFLPEISFRVDWGSLHVDRDCSEFPARHGV